jgi:hypothetical protein
MEPTPYIDAQGQRYFNLWQAAQIIGTISKGTLWNWGKKGRTPEPYAIDLGFIKRNLIIAAIIEPVRPNEPEDAEM